MSPLGWSRVHGAATHFPIALLFCAAFFDLLALLLHRSSSGADYKAVGYWLILLSGMGSFAAVMSGLALTEWKPLGSGGLRQHHLFVWPAFALTVGLATWRLLVGKSPSRPAFLGYLSILAATCAIVAAAGWSGGELIGR